MIEPSDRRTELLARIVDEFLARGVGDLSLRPLAERVGTSARLLIYHFDSKEQLVADALEEVRQAIGQSLHIEAERTDPQSLRALMMMVWDWATAQSNQRYLRLLFEVDGLAMYDRIHFSRETRKANSAIWMGLIERARARLPHRDGDLFAANATLIMGALVGLLQEFLSTGDRESTTEAFSGMIEMLRANSHAMKRT
jgi:AcrR family transcriptional regulator